MVEGLFWYCCTTTPADVAERVTAEIRLLMMFWKSAVSKRPPAQVKVAPASTCWLVSGCRAAFPKIVVPIGVTVKFAPSSVAVGALKPLEAPPLTFSQSATRNVAPAE